jgi:hypothetical protein
LLLVETGVWRVDRSNQLSPSSLFSWNDRPARYDLDVGPPPNQGWIKTNTLEGGHGWDYWLYESWIGYDNEFVVGAERFPMATAGFTRTFNEFDPPDPGFVTLMGQILVRLSCTMVLA